MGAIMAKDRELCRAYELKSETLQSECMQLKQSSSEFLLESDAAKNALPAEHFQRSDEVKRIFSPGKIGMDFNFASGRVGRIIPGGQADRAALEAGMVMIAIDGYPYTESL